jgi:osmotically-inducible protein OsmY
MKIFKYAFPLLVACTVLGASSCASTATQSSAGEYLDDTVITARVKTAIFADEDLKAREINVETFKGVVQLSGFVSTNTETLKAGELARGIDGVQSVRNDILIK